MKKYLDKDGLEYLYGKLSYTYYKKLTNGIPKTDLANAVQTSLDKADVIRGNIKAGTSFVSRFTAAGLLKDVVNYDFTPVTNPTGNPNTLGYYEIYNNGFILTNDTTVTSGKQYYSKLADSTNKATIKALYGNSIVWNQNTPSLNATNYKVVYGTGSFNNGVCTFTASAKFGHIESISTFVSIISGHKYLVCGKIKTTVSNGVTLELRSAHSWLTGFSISSATGWNTIKTIYTATRDLGDVNIVVMNSNESNWAPIEAKELQLFDLTLMFGAGKEPTTVAEFEAMFPLNYYKYDAGRLLNFTADGIVTTGFNQWDEEWEQGIYDTNGAKEANSNYIRSKNFIRVFPNTSYYTQVVIRRFYYDASKTLISYSDYNNGEFITPANCSYVTFNCASNYGNTYNNDICINLSWSGYRNGEYEQHWSSKMPLPITTITGKKDGEGESVVIFPEGLKSAGNVRDEIQGTKAIKRIGVVDLGTLNWTYHTSAANISYFVAIVPDLVEKESSVLCSKYTYGGVAFYSSNNLTDKRVYHCLTDDWRNRVMITDSSYTSSEAFKTAMNGVLLYYELANPEVYELDQPFAISYKVDSFGTERITNTVDNNDNPITTPLVADIEYNIDKQEVPLEISTFVNDAKYVTEDEFNSYIDLMSGLWYGIEWTDANTTPTRIGSTDLHRSLPIQNKMRRCVLKDDGTVNYYLKADDSTKKENGADAVLDGSDGQVMVEIPEYYYEAYNVTSNNTTTHRLILYPFAKKGVKSHKVYVGAYEGSISNDMLCSVCNTVFTSSGVWDNNGTKLLPTTSKTRAQFRTAAANRGTGWSQQYWDAYMSIVRLYVVEYCNFNSQATYNASLTSDGYKQGGLGAGVSTTSNWDANGYNPFIPCGITNNLGNATGVVATSYSYVGTTNTMSFSGTVPSYRGIENPWGHIWKWTDGVNIYTESGLTTVYTCSNISNFADATSTNYTSRCTFAKPSDGYISTWNWDLNGDFIPTATGGSSVSGLCDYSWWNDGWRVLSSGGSADIDSRCGWFYFYADVDASGSYAYVGGRLYYTK